MINLKHPHPNHNTVQPASADCTVLWFWLQDHCDNGTHRLIDVYQIHGNRIAHNDVVTHWNNGTHYEKRQKGVKSVH